MLYVSTRGEAPRLPFDEVMLAGLARDGGLYVPESYPQLTADEIAGFAGQPFAMVAARIVEAFAGGTLKRAGLLGMATAAYATFGHAAVTPLVQIAPGRFVLELFHGPTLAFKDVAMQLLARMMDHVLEQRGEQLTIVGATSGDTGGAAIEAFRGSARVDCIILYPEGRVSDVQRRMMTTPKDRNVHAIAINGTFDDCQALVKAMFNHHAFRDEVRLGGVNSINWARIVAQVTYYFVAAVALGAPHRKVSFVVPTGNFGDVLAGYVARRMGLPISRLTIASNDNDILPRTVSEGVYAMKAVTATSSPSMDIQVSSNFERYLFEAAGRDAARVRSLMAGLQQSGGFELGKLAKPLRTDFAAASASEAEVAAAIRQVERDSGMLIDPHTACAVVAADKTRGRDPANVEVILATAHPAKFPDALETVVGRRPPLPHRLAGLLRAKERIASLPNDLAAVERQVRKLSRATSELQR